ncbi:MAG: hypothetical protein ABIR81_06690 [Ginsengibacter sp.]
MNPVIIIAALLNVLLTGCAQPIQNESQKFEQKVGGACEGCEAVYESPIPFNKLKSDITLPDYNDAGPKLEVSGVVYKVDGKTPAGNVVVYVYHTDQKGIYAKKGDEKGWGKRHGYIRGWLKTNAKGEYCFRTLRPASYPNSTNPQHIHITIKEPGKNEYWIDEFEFADDPLRNKEKVNSKPVGGNGILTIENENGIQKGKRNIILGLNVQDYPTGYQPKPNLEALQTFKRIPYQAGWRLPYLSL